MARGAVDKYGSALTGGAGNGNLRSAEIKSRSVQKWRNLPGHPPIHAPKFTPPERHSPDAQRSSSAFLAIAAGISIVIQQALNANLRSALYSAAWSGFVSYAVGLACMGLLALALRDPIPAASLATRVPWWAWSGGLFGAIFIALSVFLVPQIGAAAFLALLVTGQMLGSITFDHFGWLGLTQRPIDAPRLIGVALLIGAPC
jgi:transporter family-2 protein